MNDCRAAFKKINKVYLYFALLSNLLTVCTSFLLLVFLKFSYGSLIYFGGVLLLCLYMWLMLVYMKYAHSNYRHSKKPRENSYKIIIWVTIAQIMIIAGQGILSLKNN